MNLKNHRRWSDKTTIMTACHLMATGKAQPTAMYLGVIRTLNNKSVTGNERKSAKRNLVIECHKIIAMASKTTTV
jgi:hypothetical protein